MSTRGRGIIKNTVFDAVTLDATGGTNDERTSASVSGIAGGTDMSAFILVAGANGDVTITILTSEDNDSFVAPETGSEVMLNITDQTLHHVAIRIPVAPFYKIHAINEGAGAVTLTVKVLSL